LLLFVLLLGCLGCAVTPSAAADTHSVRGVLVDVESKSIQQVDEFTLRTDDGQELSFVPAPNFNQGIEHLMTPGHMRQHMALGEPVTVTYRDESGKLVALSATD
jgi:hypothetical protein